MMGYKIENRDSRGSLHLEKSVARAGVRDDSLRVGR
jgi:hypothetical protein